MQYTSHMSANMTENTTTDASIFLRDLGVRVRSLRARRGISRRILAKDSGVSERYLAELESGNGNISVLRLRQVANAMGASVEDLVAERIDRSPAREYLDAYIRQADGAEIARLYDEVSARGRVQPMLIALIGLRGAGKSTLGTALAERLSLPFTELVKSIEGRAGIDVNEIFSLAGQATYRRYERQCLDDIIQRRERGVVAVGGSLVSEMGTYKRLLGSCVTIWLRATPDEHMNRVIAQGDKRPMAGNLTAMDDLKRILIERESLCEQADYSVDTSGRSIKESLEEILGLAGVRRIASHQEVA
jgi:XRE family aerobic/anaerobic benzoate catabolism transcriptional regulator